MAGYWPSAFFCMFMDQEGVKVLKLAKKEQTCLINKGFIIWLSGKCFLPDTAGSPKQAR